MLRMTVSSRSGRRSFVILGRRSIVILNEVKNLSYGTSTALMISEMIWSVVMFSASAS